MKPLLSVLFMFFSIVSFSQIDKTKTYTQTVNLDPGNKNGLIGTVTMVYSFGNCFGSAIMAYGYKDIRITKVKYNGKTYTASDLEMSSNFDDYKASLTSILAEFTFNYQSVSSKKLTYLLDDYDLGCFGQTHTISNSQTHTKALNSLGVSFSKAYCSFSYEIGDKIRAFEKRKVDNLKYRDLMVEASNENDLEEKLAILKRSKKYVHGIRDKTILDIQIKNLTTKITDKKKEEAHKKEKAAKGHSGIVLTSTSTKKSTPTKSISASKVTSSSSNSNYSYVPSSYDINQTISNSNYTYRQNFSQLDKAADQLSSLISSLASKKRLQREAAERRRAERQRKIELEEEREKDFYKQAERYRKKVKDIIATRQSYFKQGDAVTTYAIDGSNFKPIYFFYAYTKKGYDSYSENVRYSSSSMDFNIKEKVYLNFSQVMAIFPYSNGSYPYFDDIKRKIISEHFPHNPNDYDLRFFKTESTVEGVVKSLTTEMNNAIYYNEFYSATPSQKREILFLNNKIEASNSKDYWSGETVSTNKKSSVNYFKSDIQTKPKKVDYFKTNKNKTSKKTNYWDAKSKPDSLKTKKKEKSNKTNYWNN